jgi:hypothetical protein
VGSAAASDNSTSIQLLEDKQGSVGSNGSTLFIIMNYSNTTTYTKLNF